HHSVRTSVRLTAAQATERGTHDAMGAVRVLADLYFLLANPQLGRDLPAVARRAAVRGGDRGDPCRVHGRLDAGVVHARNAADSGPGADAAFRAGLAAAAYTGIWLGVVSRLHPCCLFLDRA